MWARPPLVLTKPAEQQAPWQHALSRRGWSVWSMPLLSLTRLPETPMHRTVWQNLDQYQGVIMVSPLSAQLTADALDHWWPQAPAGLHWLASGRTSAASLEGRVPELRVATPETGNTAEDLLALLQDLDIHDRHWLIVAGEGGRTTLADGLTARGARVTRLALYRREPLPISERMRQSLADHEPIIQVSSTTALEHLTSQVDPITKQRATLLVSSARVDAAAADVWQHRIIASGASLDATIEALQPFAPSDQEPTHGER